jgi:hypothetical protein
VRDLLGDTSRPADQFPLDREDAFAFRSAGVVAQRDATFIRDAAEALGALAVRNIKTLLPCDPAATGEPACARQFVETFALRAFRRPPARDEVDDLMALYQKGRDTLRLAFPNAIGLLVEAMLQGPAFLYHAESPPGPVAREGALIRLGPYEVASRLSYFLWGSMPDKDLFAAAAANKLSTAAEVAAQARRLLADPRARDTVAAFFEDWLELDALAETPKDPKLYPQFNEELKTAMAAETRAFVQNVVFEGDARLATLLEAKFSFVNKPLGAVYGMSEATGTTLQRLATNPAQRSGFLTHAGFLTVTGSAEGSHPVRRGKAIYDKLLCRTLPPPPGDVPPPKPASAGGTTRQRFVEHDKAECARACHELIDPLGFAFEHYDGIGRYRTTDNGGAVDASGTALIDGAPRSFANALALGGLLAGSNDVRRCFATQWLRFALGRNDEPGDAASIAQAVEAFGAAGHAVRDLLVAVTTARSFRYRSPAPGEVLP